MCELLRGAVFDCLQNQESCPLLPKALRDKREKGDPVEAAGIATSQRVWSASLGAPLRPPGWWGQHPHPIKHLLLAWQNQPRQFRRDGWRGASLSHSEEENSRSGLTLAGRGQQPRSPATWSSQSWALAATAVRSAGGWLGARAALLLGGRSCPLRRFSSPSSVSLPTPACSILCKERNVPRLDALSWPSGGTRVALWTAGVCRLALRQVL